MFTLSELAYFDRCLFPDDFYNELLNHGCHPALASGIRSWLVAGKGTRGIVDIQQEWVETSSDGRELEKILNQILEEFVKKYRD